MKKKHLSWRIATPFILLVLFALGTSTIYSSRSFENFYQQQIFSDLKARVDLLQSSVASSLIAKDYSELQQFCTTLASDKVRLTVILPNGNVVCDSQISPKFMDNHSDRPEVGLALTGLVGMISRYSSTIKQDMLYVAIPVRHEKSIIGILRASVSLKRLEEIQQTLFSRIAIGSFLIALCAILISVFISKRISEPLKKIRTIAGEYAQGNFVNKLPASETEEISGLAGTLNEMAQLMEERLDLVTRQKNQISAVHSSMTEGVVAIDLNEKIIIINQAAADLFGVTRQQAKGKPLHDIIRNTELQEFITSHLRSEERHETDIIMYGPDEIYLQLKSSPLRDEEKETIGILVVLNNITRMRKLEKMRRDFVANVSHELKTPLTSIRGFAETLLEDENMEAADRKKFISIIVKQTHHLNDIINELLQLSTLEQQTERAEIEYEICNIKNIILSAIESFQTQSTTKSYILDYQCEARLSATVNAALIRQALTNLIDNAIKYGGPACKINLAARIIDEQLEITVTDTGPGIPEENIPRLFERFYRVDKSRSRNLGGTGLGLAIVKHIVEAHNGQVMVTSKLGKGSCFTIRLPV